jgi:transcriptional regulator with XRE-family HTH domain
LSLSAEQIRMARAALKLTMRDLAARAEIDKSTLVRIEAGYGAHPFTLRQLREVLEAAGVLFLDADESGGPGVRLKLGVEIPTRAPGDGATTGEDGEGGMKAAWDDFAEAADLDAPQAKETAFDPGMAEYWRTDPGLWDSLSASGRATLSLHMFGHPYAGEGHFRKAEGDGTSRACGAGSF